MSKSIDLYISFFMLLFIIFLFVTDRKSARLYLNERVFLFLPQHPHGDVVITSTTQSDVLWKRSISVEVAHGFLTNARSILDFQDNIITNTFLDDVKVYLEKKEDQVFCTFFVPNKLLSGSNSVDKCVLHQALIAAALSGLNRYTRSS